MDPDMSKNFLNGMHLLQMEILLTLRAINGKSYYNMPSFYVLLDCMNQLIPLKDMKILENFKHLILRKNIIFCINFRQKLIYFLFRMS